jgi:nucleoside-diphosphate-sugar epimerase
VLVTGASGFIGRAACDALAARGFEVHGAGRTAAPDRPGVRWHAVDLLAAGGMARAVRAAAPSHVLHLAWNATPGVYWASPDNTAWQAATASLAASAAGARFVGVGSCAEYDWSVGGTCDERDACAPATPYGRAKLAAGQHVLIHHTNAAWARIFLPFGPFEPASRLVPSVIRALLRGETALCTSGAHARDFLYVDDVGRALAALVDSPVRGVVNVGSGQGVPVRDVVLAVQARLGGRVDLGARALPEGEPVSLVADVRRLRDEVGFSPAVGLDEGLERSIAWWRLERSA